MEEKSLFDCEVGDIFTINRIEENDSTKNYLYSLGFLKNVDVLVLQKYGDSVVIKIFESRLGIESNITSNIYGHIKENNKSNPHSKSKRKDQ